MSKQPYLLQYRKQKALAPDAILLFRVGDFYEIFDDDAKTAAQVLGITLTHFDHGPLAGIPYHLVDCYIAKLVKAGHQVAVSEAVA